MKKLIHFLMPLLLVILVIASIGWYLFVYDRAFTRDILLQQARNNDLKGNTSLSSWFYNMAYSFSGQDENVAIELANRAGVPVTLVCDDAHVMNRPGADTITVLRGADSADLRLVNLLRPGDVAVTQDYGLAALCLARGASAIDQNGRVYDSSNIDGLLAMRHVSAKIRRSGGRLRGPHKRTREQDAAFAQSLYNLLRKGDDCQ